MKQTEAAARPNILIVTGVLWIGGGAEKVAANLGNYFTDQGYTTHVLTFYEAAEKFPYHGIYHTFNEGTKKNWLHKIPNIPLRIWKIHRYAKQHEIDVVYAFLEEASFYVLLARVLFWWRRTVIVSVRNNTDRLGRVFRFASRVLYPHADTVVAVTKAIEHQLQTHWQLGNTTTIYNSLDMDWVAQEITEPLPEAYQWVAEQQPLIMSIGRLIQQKGQWHLIRAFSAVQQQHPEAKLAIVGDGNYRDQLTELINACGLSDSVHLLGKHANVYRFLVNADLFVFSSLWEGMPNTMLEALSVGLPIVSTDCVSGPREIIAPELGVLEATSYPRETPYGILVAAPDNDAPIWATPEHVPLIDAEIALAAAITDMLDRQWFRGAAHTAYRARIAEEFEQDTVMRQWEALL